MDAMVSGAGRLEAHMFSDALTSCSPLKSRELLKHGRDGNGSAGPMVEDGQTSLHGMLMSLKPWRLSRPLRMHGA